MKRKHHKILYIFFFKINGQQNPSDNNIVYEQLNDYQKHYHENKHGNIQTLRKCTSKFLTSRKKINSRGRKSYKML